MTTTWAWPGANVVATAALLSLHENLADVVEQRAMMCVHGDAGLGKTLSVNAALRALVPADVCRVQFRARPTPRDIRHVLFEALGVGGSPPSRPIEFDTLLKDALAERFRVLVCDEAQWLSRECFELWRHLWDDRRTNIAIVFVGGGDCYRVLRREPMLSSRVYVWQEFRRLDCDQVLAVIPAYHPVWADADPADIAYTDAHAGHGNFRAWSKITSHVVTALARLGCLPLPMSPPDGIRRTRVDTAEAGHQGVHPRVVIERPQHDGGLTGGPRWYAALSASIGSPPATQGIRSWQVPAGSPVSFSRSRTGLRLRVHPGALSQIRSPGHVGLDPFHPLPFPLTVVSRRGPHEGRRVNP